jgi:putative transcriptional regulator
MSMRINRVTFAAELARRDWRDKRLAELSGVSRVTLSAIRSGKSVAPNTAQKIAAALNVPLEELLEVTA